MKILHTFTKPSAVLKAIDSILPWSLVATLIFAVTGLTFALIFSPADYVQGETVRIMYVHVPASWGALAIYTAMALSAAFAFISRIFLFHLITKSLASIGTYFTAISLITGSIWGKPTWGTWWVWDARLTSMLVLFFLYLGYQTLASSADDDEKSLNTASILAIIGWINVPIIKWSVDWWYTLHQPPSIMLSAKPAIHSSMLWPLAFMSVCFAASAITLLCWKLRTELYQRKLISLQMRQPQS